MIRALSWAALGAVVLSVSLRAQSGSHESSAKEIFKQLVEINTTQSVGNTTQAAEAMAARFKAAGFPDADVRVLGPSAKKGNLVVRYRGTGAKRPMILLAHLDVVEAKREDWSFDPFVLTEKDGYFYGRGTADDKAMAAVFVANLIRLKAEGFVPARDIILVLTADEEGGPENGVEVAARQPSRRSSTPSSPSTRAAAASCARASTSPTRCRRRRRSIRTSASRSATAAATARCR